MSKTISAPLIRTARLLDLVPFLSSHQGISIQELAKQFEVTPVQISADLMTLWMCGLPGYTALELMDLSFESGFVTIRNAPTLAKPRTITFDEGLALLLGLALLNSALPVERSDLVSTIDKLSARIAERVGLPRSFQVWSAIAPDIGTVIAKALVASTAVRIEYHSLYSDLVSARTIMPIEIYHENGNSYLKAFCYSANAVRIFRVDRILKTDLADLMQRQEIPVPKVAKVAFSIEILKPSRDLFERFKIEESTGSQTIPLDSYSQQWIERSIMAAGAGAKLLQPFEIGAEIAAKAQLMLDRYQAN